MLPQVSFVVPIGVGSVFQPCPGPYSLRVVNSNAETVSMMVYGVCAADRFYAIESAAGKQDFCRPEKSWYR